MNGGKSRLGYNAFGERVKKTTPSGQVVYVGKLYELREESGKRQHVFHVHAQEGALADQVHSASDETERSAANTDADDRWRALEQWNGGAAGLSDDGGSPAPSEARWLYAQLFPAPDGLRFITHRPRAQWTAMVQRMNVLQGERAQAAITGFGGTRHWKQLVAAHARFGDAFGFTAVATEPEGGPTDGRPQWVSAREALQALVLKIESYADPEIPGSEALVAFLLRPYVEMADDLTRNRRTTRPKKTETVPVTPAGAPATP